LINRQYSLLTEGPKAPEMTRAFHSVGPKETKECLRTFLKNRFPLEDTDHVATVLFSTLLSMRMGVLVGLYEKPSEQEIVDYAEKTINLIMKVLK